MEFKRVIDVPSSDESYSKVSTEVSIGSVSSTSFGSSGLLANPKRHPVSMVMSIAVLSPNAMTFAMAFFFILFNNMLGIIPFFPGGANVTGNINITFILAVCTFLAINLFGTKKYWKDIFWPEVPTWLKVPVPLMPVIELVGVFTKPFTLMIRLFANMLAGHFMILGVIAVIFITAEMGAALCAGLGFIAVVMGIFMDCLELLVAFLQAYIFTMLSAVFIGLAHPDPVED